MREYSSIHKDSQSGFLWTMENVGKTLHLLGER